MWLKAGNDAILKVLCKDIDNVNIDNLADANEIICHIITNPIIEKKKSLGEILINDPSTGYLKIKIDASDTVNLPDVYPIGVEIQWTDNIQELELEDEEGSKFNMIRIKHNIVNPT